MLSGQARGDKAGPPTSRPGPGDPTSPFIPELSIFWKGAAEEPGCEAGPRASSPTQEVITAPPPIGGKPRPCRPRENQLAPCLVLGPGCPPHYLGIYVPVTMKDSRHSFSTGRSLARGRAQAAGGGAVLLGAGWGFDFRGICDRWEPPRAHGGSGLFSEAHGWPRGEGAGDLLRPSVILPFRREQEEPGMDRVSQPNFPPPTCREPGVQNREAAAPRSGHREEGKQLAGQGSVASCLSPWASGLLCLGSASVLLV